jgi:small subunit ribosomal protein S20
MANTKSAKKRVLQNNKRRQVNLSRKTCLKTAVKKVLDAVKAGDYENSMILLKDAEAKFARAKGKKVVHANAAARKTSRLAQKVAALAKEKQS